MTVQQLHEITSAAIAAGQGNIEVMVNTASFYENDEGSVFEAEKAEVELVEAADDSGPTGEKYPFLVISGPVPLRERDENDDDGE